ncbi:hypothetical protein ABH922_001598 [Rhodococcus sp. 27YEA15]|uniref:hypothetical protein n=1 Tax=Rhodococcus sp. 27YEA15 TaxID=3156259 RepID=UPI003C7B14C7
MTGRALDPWSEFELTGRPNTHHVDHDVLENYRFTDGGGFPPSYKDFVTAFGWARVLGGWLVYPPVRAGFADGWQGRARNLTERFESVYADNLVEDFDFTLEPDGDWSLIGQLEVFAYSENGDALLWDVAARDEFGEFPIWLSVNLNSLERLPGTLPEAFVHLRTNRGIGPAIDATIEPLPPSRL